MKLSGTGSVVLLFRIVPPLRRRGLKAPSCALAPLEAYALEVAVASPHSGAFGLSCGLVVFALALRIRASHADRVGVEHGHRPAHREGATASVAFGLREESVCHNR